MSPFAAQLFLLPFSSHCSTQNIGIIDSGYIIKPRHTKPRCLRSSAFYRAPFLAPLEKIIPTSMAVYLLQHKAMQMLRNVSREESGH